MRIVVRGNAMISPMNPSRDPQTDKDRSSTAGLSPMALPMILGVSTRSVMSCTIINTRTAEPKIIQKFSPVSADLSNDKNTIGMKAKPCTYGMRLINPIRIPKPMAMGKPMMVKPIQKRIPMQSATIL